MNRKSVLKNPVLWILAAVLAFLAYNTIFDSDRGYTQVPISIANQQITANNVKEASQEDKEQQIKLLLNKKIEVDGQQVDQI
ncbi:cell division protein FtsH, partial [Amycolatopsis lurida]